LDIRTSSNNIVLSDGDGNPRLWVKSDGSVFIGTTDDTLYDNTVANDGGAVFINDANGVRLDIARDNTCMTLNRPSTTGLLAGFYQAGGTAVGNISVTVSATSYNTSSDYRLKENVVYDWDATTRLKQLKPARFNFITEADKTVDGFLAHEAQAVVPEAVHGTHNEVDADGVAVMQGIDQSKLVPLLVKTIQELEARITALES
jgi:hypothetical protein